MLRQGLHLNVPTADYFADPAPAPSLTQSLAKILLEKSPLHAWHAHPRLNPDYRHDDDTKFDIGNIAHKLLIGRGKELVVLDFDDWRTKAAREARESASRDGKFAVLGKHVTMANAMVRAAREQIDLRGLPGLFRYGDGEVVTVWQEGPAWLRQMLDWLSEDRRVVADYKSTEMSAAPHAIARKMVTDGWDVQAAMAERGLDVLDPGSAGRRRYLFVVQETARPYCLSIAELSEAVLTMGRKRLHYAVGAWKTCAARDCWPGYPTAIVMPEYPGWAETQWLEREVAEAGREETVASDHLMAG